MRLVVVAVCAAGALLVAGCSSSPAPASSSPSASSETPAASESSESPSPEPSHVGLDLAGLDLSTLGKLRKGGGTSGKGIVVPFDSKGSAIVQKLKGTYAFGTRMPKDGPAFWRDEDIQKVVDWIDQGAEGADDE